MTQQARQTTPPSALPARRSDARRSDARRTAGALLATALGLLPLAELFTGLGWVFDAWMAALVVAGPAALLRIRQPAHVWHAWLGLGLLVPWLTMRFVPHAAFAGLIPTTGTWHDVDALLTSVRDTTSNGVAPVHATAGVEFVLAMVAGLLAALVDFIAVVGRRSALAGVPLLVIYTVSGAVPRHPVSWVLFTASAVGFLLLLSLDAQDTVRDWGRIIPRQDDSRASSGLGVSAPRIAVLAVGAAILLPLVAPSRTSNLIADALHNGNSTGKGGSGGFGATGGVALDPFAALKGELQRPKPQSLFTVAVSPGAKPFYLRANVLVNYTDRGWTAAGHAGTEDASTALFDTLPETRSVLSTDRFRAELTITGLADNPPVFARPTGVDGLARTATWSSVDQLLLGPRVHRGQRIVERVEQPAPTEAQLAAAGDVDPAEMTPWLQQPAQMPRPVVDLVDRLTAGKATPYAKARALSDYFTDPTNGFTYSLQTKAGDSGSALVDFLSLKTGYCQQYAAALGIMLRMAGVPARVVLGYTHGAPNADGQFTVTTTNAHAWVEAFFDGLGWIPFDPTPIAGAAGGATTSLPWAPHPSASTAPGHSVSTAPRGGRSNQPDGGSVSNAPAASGAQHGGAQALWPILAVLAGLALVLVVVLTPAGLRWRRRRARLRAAGHGDPDPLWAELSATAVDLGYVWSPARSPRQVVGWLAPQVGRESVAALRTLAAAVETARYAPRFTGGAASVRELRTIEAELRGRRNRATRLRSRLLPASLGWRLGMPRVRRR